MASANNNNALLQQLAEAVSPAWQHYQQTYTGCLNTTIPLMAEINDYVNSHRGKQLRPLLLLLCAAATHRLDDKSPLLAAAVELLHNASLLHDDVVDNDTIRRGQPSVQVRWNARIAILAGDYFLSHVMDLLGQVNDPDADRILTRSAISMTEGELLQLSNTAARSEPEYLDILFRKTGSLLQSCCILGGGEPLAEFGRHFGLAFQLRDDLLDYDSEPHSNKPDFRRIQELRDNEIAAALQSLHSLEQNQFIQYLKQLTLFLQ